MQYQACIYPQIHVFKVQGPVRVSRPARTSTPCTFLASRYWHPMPCLQTHPMASPSAPTSQRLFSFFYEHTHVQQQCRKRKCHFKQKKRRHVRGSTDFFYEFSFRLTPHFSGQCDHILNFNLKRSVELKKIKL